MYVHKACKPSEVELDWEKKAGGYCAQCGQSGTIYHVKGTEDVYSHMLNGWMYHVVDGVESDPNADMKAGFEVEARKARARKRGVAYEAVNSTSEAVEDFTGVDKVIEEIEAVEVVEATSEEVAESIAEIEAETIEEAVEVESEPSKPLAKMSKAELLEYAKTLKNEAE